jgi:hypothetical protein
MIMVVALLFISPALAPAQDTQFIQAHGAGYVFVGTTTHQLGTTAGFGGERYVYRGLGVGAEVATSGWDTSANGNPNWIGIGSADLSYHFFSKKHTDRPAPFITGGYSAFFGQDVFVHYPGPRSSSNVQNGSNVGGGVDILLSKHAGLRFDVRYNAHGGRILWASFPNLAELSFTAFRIGLTFR